jgi:YesN/AraC family two-component response regulator
MKIQKSCQLLGLSDLKIKEISKQIGYEDAYYFSRLFKKIMGKSPMQYRKSMRE